MSQVASEHLGESLGTDFFSVRVLATTRSTCAWGALGHATAAYDAASSAAPSPASAPSRRYNAACAPPMGTMSTR